MPAIAPSPDTSLLSVILENTPEKPLPTLTPSTLMFESNALVSWPNPTPSLSAIPATGWPTSEPAIFAPSSLSGPRELVRALPDAVDGRRERVAVEFERVAQVLVEIRFELLQARQARLELAGHLLEFPGELAESAVTEFAERVEHVGDLVHVAADPGEQCERSGQLAETAGDVLNGDAAVLQPWLNAR